MLLAIIILTLLDGTPVYVEGNAIQVIRPAHQKGSQCAATVGAGIHFGSHWLCVRETPEQILKKIGK